MRLNEKLLKVPVFVGRVFFILIQIFDLQNSVCCIKQKIIIKQTLRRWTNMLYGSGNALWVTKLIS